MRLIDTHCHLDAAEFDTDRQDVIARARSSGVIRQIVPAVDAAGWGKLRDVCATDAGLFAAYGLHPIALSAHQPEHITALSEWVEREQPVAVGECGLDFHLDLDVPAQQRLFDAQLAVARRFDLPVIVHARRAVDAVIASIKRAGVVRGVVHSFSGSVEQARQLWKLDFLLGIGGPITYARANRLRKLVGTMPLEFLVLETDAPDQPDSTHRGQRNEPSRLGNVLQAVAQLRDVAPAEIAKATTDNAERLFRLPSDAGDLAMDQAVSALAGR